MHRVVLVAVAAGGNSLRTSAFSASLRLTFHRRDAEDAEDAQR